MILITVYLTVVLFAFYLERVEGQVHPVQLDLAIKVPEVFDKMFIPTLLWLQLLIEKVVVLDVKIVLKFKLTQSLEGV